MKKRNTTIKDVAELARVSPMTVSRVLNHQDTVKETTRKRVQAAMRQLNYRPNSMARNLAGRTGLFIGLIYRNPSYGYLSEFLLGALDTCRRLGHNLIVEEPLVDQNMVDLEQIERRFLDTSIQALMVVPPLSDDPKLIDVLERTGIAFVCISPRRNAYTGPSVGMDDAAAATEMTDYLLGLGHKRIGLIKGPPDHMSSDLRHLGFVKAHEARDIATDPDLIANGEFDYVSGMRATQRMLARTAPPTAIFASNDDMAAGAIAAAHQAGLRVPEDLSVAGFDDTANASAMWPPLTTVRQPIREMASRAIEVLGDYVGQRRGAGLKVTGNQVLRHELVIRQSTAPPRKQGG